MAYLLDTCFLSDLTAKQPVPGVKRWFFDHDPGVLFLSVVTLGEVRKGAELARGAERRDQIEAWLDQLMTVEFSGRILPVDADVALRWGILLARGRLARRTLPAVDALIAATAIHHGLTLVTRNERDFADTGVEIANPWATA